jgi:hypothetical protein
MARNTNAPSCAAFPVMGPRMTSKRITTTLAALVLAGLLAACGGGDSGDGDDVASASDDDSSEQAQTDESEEATDQELYDWVECMRDEGVDLPDPTRDADGNLVISGNGINLGGSGSAANQDDGGGGGASPIDPEEMAAAQEVCGEPPLLGAGDISDEDQQAQQEDALAFAQCMRDQGIEDFPDPDFSDEGSGSQDDTSEDGDGGDGPSLSGPFGDIDLGDPEVAAAYEACQDVLALPEGQSSTPNGAAGDSET